MLTTGDVSQVYVRLESDASPAAVVAVYGNKDTGEVCAGDVARAAMNHYGLSGETLNISTGGVDRPSQVCAHNVPIDKRDLEDYVFTLCDFGAVSRSSRVDEAADDIADRSHADAHGSVARNTRVVCASTASRPLRLRSFFRYCDDHAAELSIHARGCTRVYRPLTCTPSNRRVGVLS